MIRTFKILCLCVALTGCMAAQRFYFSEVTPVDFNVPEIGKLFDQKAKYAIRIVISGSYDNYGEFNNYSWHGVIYVDGQYEGFRKLPYQDPNIEVRRWLGEVL